jgi:hypothetical protein
MPDFSRVSSGHCWWKVVDVLWIAADEPSPRISGHPAGADVRQEVDVVLAPADEAFVGLDANDSALCDAAAARCDR